MTASRAMRAGPVRIVALAAAPVFYQVPLYRLLADDPRVELTVLYASSGGVRPYDAGFGGRRVVWDVDLLTGYRHQFLRRADENDILGGFLALRDPDVVQCIRRGCFDVLWTHGFSYLTLWLGIAAAVSARMPILVREEQTLLHSRRRPKSWVRAGVLRTLFSRMYGLYIGSANRAYFQRYGVAPERLFFTPYCVDNDALRLQAAELRPQRAELRADYGVGPDAGPLILFVGKLVPKKDPLRLLDAFAGTRSRHRCALVFVGEGELEQELRQRVSERRVRDVHFAGFHNRSQIARAYAAADIFVLSSTCNETWGLVVNEAMNFELPVIVSDKVGSGYDLVRHGRNGYVFPAGDAKALAGALDRLVASAARRQEFGRRSAEIVSAWSYEQAKEGIVAASTAAVRRRRDILSTSEAESHGIEA